MIQLAEGIPKVIKTEINDDFKITPEQLEKAINKKTKAFLFSSPCNPTGTILEKLRLNAASDWAKEYGAHLLVDEIYHGLQYVEDLPSVLEVDDTAFVVSSFSKYFGMTGWRLGWIVVPEDFVETATILTQNLFISAPSIAQYAALAAFTDEAEAIFEERRKAFADRKSYLGNELTKLGFKISDNIQGAFYFYANIFPAFG